MEVALPKWRHHEPVNEVVYGTRGFDTFGETFLLLAAVVGIMTITRGKEPRGGSSVRSSPGGASNHKSSPRRPSKPRGRAARAAEREEEGDTQGPLTPDEEPLGPRRPSQPRP